jgi:hypothetical protein
MKLALSTSAHFPGLLVALVGKVEMRSAFATALFENSLVCILRSQRLDSARKYSEWAVHLAQSCEDQNQVDTLCDWNASVALLSGASQAPTSLWHPKPTLLTEDQGSQSRLFNLTIQHLSESNFVAALDNIHLCVFGNRNNGGDTLIGSSAKNLEGWILFMTGQVNACAKVLDNSPKVGNASRAQLEELWSYHIRVIIAMLNGAYALAQTYLRRMDSRECGRRGKLYHYALSCILSIVERQHLSDDGGNVQLCVSNLASCARALGATTPSTPIAVITTFLVAYSSATVLERDDHLRSSVSRGDGHIHRLLTSVWSLRDMLKNTVAESFPFLQSLVESLDVKMLRILSSRGDAYKHIHAKDVISRILRNAHQPSLSYEPIPQSDRIEFSFGKLFWWIEMRKYTHDADIRQGAGMGDTHNGALALFEERCLSAHSAVTKLFGMPPTHVYLA